MATTRDYKDFVLENLSPIGDISCRQMMGEYLLYYQGTLFGGIYDNRFLIKMTINNKQFNLPEVKPYDNAKNMYLVENLYDIDAMKSIIYETVKDLINGINAT